MRLLDVLAFTAIGFGVLLGVYCLFVWAPVAAFAEMECLEKGYPEYRVDIALNKYCMNLEGDVVIKVEKL